METPEEDSFGFKDFHKKPFYFLGIADFERLIEMPFDTIYGEKQQLVMNQILSAGI